jgi:hypothetical protein
MKGHIMYALPAALTKSLQRRIYSGQIDPEQMYAEIDKNLVRRKIEQPKQ